MAKTRKKKTSTGRTWVLDPHSGGVPIPKSLHETIRQRILKYAQKHYAGSYTRLDIRFRGPLCYIDAFTEPNLSPGWPPKNHPETRAEMIERLRNTPVHLCRLRHFTVDRWSCAFFTYSNEKYSPCVFDDGSFFGTLEQGFAIGATYLTE